MRERFTCPECGRTHPANHLSATRLCANCYGLAGELEAESRAEARLRANRAEWERDLFTRAGLTAKQFAVLSDLYFTTLPYGELMARHGFTSVESLHACAR